MLQTFGRTVRLGAVALLTTAFFSLAAPAHATKIERVVSPGGIEFWLVRDATVPLVAINFAFRGGSSQDPADKAGVAELAVGLLDEGAGDLDGPAFQKRLESKAIELQLRASRDHVRGTLRTLKENQDEAFDLLRLALTAPRFDANAVERVRSQMISRLQRQSTNPNNLASRNWWQAAFPDHPYGRSGNGTLDSVPRIVVDDLRAYVRHVLARDTLKLAVVGDIDAANAGRLIDFAFGSLPAKAELRAVPSATLQGQGALKVVQLDVPQAVIMFGSPGLARNDPDFMTAYVVNHILGGGSFSSRLYSEVREKRGLAYGVYTSLTWLHGTALLVGNTGTRADAAAETIKVIENEFQRMAKDGPTEKELNEAKTYLKGSFVLGLDTSTKIANQLVQIQLDDLGIDYIERRAALIDAVTLADARRVAKRLLDSGFLTVVVGRPNGLMPRGPGG
ncbi:MAG: M16 family metallopeptidase [Xanthobacteraceae bacterium]